MVKVTFDYGNKEDHKLVQEIIGGKVGIKAAEPKTLVEMVKAEKKAPEPAPKNPMDTFKKEETPVAEPTSTPVEAPAPEAKAITPEAALPLVAAYCQANGLDKPQAFFARVGKGNIHELTPAELNELLAELEIEV